MYWTLRRRLLAVVVAFGLASALSITSTTLIEQRADSRVREIQQRLIPHLELGMRVEAQFEELSRQMQAAVAAQDADLLEAAEQTGTQLLSTLQSVRAVADQELVDQQARAVAAYSEAARAVARRLIAEETGEELVERMREMKGRQDEARALLAKARLDPVELNRAFESARRTQVTARNLRLAINVAALLLALTLALVFSRGIVRNVAKVSAGLRRFASGDFDETIEVGSGDEVGAIAQQANSMSASLARLSSERDRQDWLRNGTTGLLLSVRGELSVTTTAERALKHLVGYLEAAGGAIYHRAGSKLELVAAIGLSRTGSAARPEFELGEGLVGRVAASAEFMVLRDLPPHDLRIESAVIGAGPSTVLLSPIRRADNIVGVIELALLRPFEERARELLQDSGETLAIALEVAASRAQTELLLEETRAQAARLTAQEEELRANNEELEAQHDDVRRANDELAAQRTMLEQRNLELEAARVRLEETAKQLALASSHKSRFLANMSHELRTPLNSMLLLSGLLADRQAGPLTDAQAAHCRTIHQSGQALLTLINDLLDLAKIEAGVHEIDVQATLVEGLRDHVIAVLGPLAKDKGLGFEVSVDTKLPEKVNTDARRFQQILTNLVSNAIKFTKVGKVSVAFNLARSDGGGGGALELVVSDTGVGIEPDQQAEVFNAFHRAQSSKSITGTGLGLAIVRELVALLGGEIQLRSTVGEGSVFTCYFPLEGPARGALRDDVVGNERAHMDSARVTATPEVVPAKAATSMERRRRSASATLLVIEDEPVFASQLASIVQQRGFGVAVAHTGENGLRLAERISPSGILLDLKLPDIDGFAVLERLKASPATRDIPVHVISALDVSKRAVASGAASYLGKPATQQQLVRVIEGLRAQATDSPIGPVLVVQGGEAKGAELLALLAHAGIEARSARRSTLDVLDAGDAVLVVPVETVAAALELLRESSQTVPERSWVLHVSQPLSRDEAREASQLARAVVIDDGASAERLVQEMRLFLRHVSEQQRRREGAVPEPASSGVHAQVRLEGKRILLTDDDMRTVYAVSALLRGRGAEVVVAENGTVALQALEATDAPVDCILMDIMMPEMDGFEAIAAIRKQSRLARVPIIALTAKAMVSDRDKCLSLGADVYLPKPVDAALLLDRIGWCLAEARRERPVA